MNTKKQNRASFLLSALLIFAMLCSTLPVGFAQETEQAEVAATGEVSFDQGSDAGEEPEAVAPEEAPPAPAEEPQGEVQGNPEGQPALTAEDGSLEGELAPAALDEIEPLEDAEMTTVTSYEELVAAIESHVGDAPIYLANDISYTPSGNLDTPAVTIAKDLTLRPAPGVASVTFQVNGTSRSCCRHFKVSNNATLTLEYITLSGNEFSGGILVNEGVLKLTNATIQDCSARKGGAIEATNANVAMEDSLIQGCKSTGYRQGYMALARGGGIYLDNCTLTLVGTQVKKCSASLGANPINDSTPYGGGIAAFNGSDVTLDKTSVISECFVVTEVGSYSAYTYGGGIYTEDSTLTLIGATIEGCYAVTGVYSGSCYGGGIVANNGTVLMSDGATVKDCYVISAKENDDTRSGMYLYGGGIYLYCADLTVDGSHIKGCDSSNEPQGQLYDDGGVYGSTARGGAPVRVTLKNNATISGCTSGAAIYLGGGINNMDVYLENSQISNCESGVIARYLVASGSREPGVITFTAKGMTIEDCQGSGILIDNLGSVPHSNGEKNASSALIKDCVIRNCASAAWGGGISAKEIDIIVEDTLIEECSTTGNGGGIYFYGVAHLIEATIRNTTIKGCAGGGGGGIYSGFVILTVEKTRIEDCVASDGGGFYLVMYGDGSQSRCAVLIKDSVIKNCSAERTGGGIYTYAPGSKAVKITIEDTLIEACTAKENGGGARLEYPTAVMFNRVTLKENTATNGGGVYLVGYGGTNPPEAFFKNCNFDSNRASNNGGGICQATNYLFGLKVHETVFTGNRAITPASLAEYDRPLYEENITYETDSPIPLAFRTSIPGNEYSYNNYDIGYRGDLIPLSDASNRVTAQFSGGTGRISGQVASVPVSPSSSLMLSPVSFYADPEKTADAVTVSFAPARGYNIIGYTANGADLVFTAGTALFMDFVTMTFDAATNSISFVAPLMDIELVAVLEGQPVTDPGSGSTPTIEEYTLTYHANGGSGAPSGGTYQAGERVTVASGSGMTREGYLFQGWGESRTSASPDYSAGESFTMPSNHVTLYGVWEATGTGTDANTYQLSYVDTLRLPVSDHYPVVDRSIGWSVFADDYLKLSLTNEAGQAASMVVDHDYQLSMYQTWGDYTLSFTVTDPDGGVHQGETAIHIYDPTAPEIGGKTIISIVQGTQPDTFEEVYALFDLSTRDNYDETPTLTHRLSIAFDTWQWNVGDSYGMLLTSTDSYGNTTEKLVSVLVMKPSSTGQETEPKLPDGSSFLPKEEGGWDIFNPEGEPIGSVDLVDGEWTWLDENGVPMGGWVEAPEMLPQTGSFELMMLLLAACGLMLCGVLLRKRNAS